MQPNESVVATDVRGNLRLLDGNLAAADHNHSHGHGHLPLLHVIDP